MASWGSGKPVIAFGSDIDGIPKASQKPGVAYHDPLVEGAPGHGEGHNSGQAVNVTAAIVLKRIMEREKIQGTLRLWPGVAEELVASKAWFIRAGYFKDVDVCIFTHVGNDLTTRWGTGSGNGLVSVEYTFHGESAHSAGRPWRGRSALDAVELMNTAMNFRREHLRLAQRTHYVITNGGDQPNVVPSEASRLVLLPRARPARHQAALRDRKQDREGGGGDDGYRGELADPRDRLPAALQQSRRRGDVEEHREGRTSPVERGGSEAREGAPEGARRQGGRSQDRAREAGGAGARGPTNGGRLGRHRRHHVERAYGDAAVSLEHSRADRTIIGRMPSPWRRPSPTRGRPQAPRSW